MDHLIEAYEHADRSVMHWRLILAGHLSPTQREHARYELVRAVGQLVRARIALEAATNDAMVAA